jgi:hypothetical protein
MQAIQLTLCQIWLRNISAQPACAALSDILQSAWLTRCAWSPIYCIPISPFHDITPIWVPPQLYVTNTCPHLLFFRGGQTHLGDCRENPTTTNPEEMGRLMHNVGQHSRDINKKAIPQSQLVELMQTQNQCILCQLLQICTFGWQLRDPKCALLKSCGLGWPLSACMGEFKHSGYANVAQSFKRKSHKSDHWLQH